MDRYSERQQKGSGNYGSRGGWGHRSSANRRTPFAGHRTYSVPTWEKKFCESNCLIPWHKILEAKKFMHLYENVNKWNDTAAEEAFKNAKSRFFAEMNGLPCNVKLPDPDTYIDKVDWNSYVDPELLLDLERGPDIDSTKSGGAGEAESDTAFILNNEPIVCNEGWGDLNEVPVPPAVNWNETVQCGGWNNWDDDVDENNNRGGEWNGGNGWGEERVNHYSSWDHGCFSSGKNAAFDRIDRNQAPPNNIWRRKEGDRGFKNSRGRQRQERPR